MGREFVSRFGVMQRDGRFGWSFSRQVLLIFPNFVRNFLPQQEIELLVYVCLLILYCVLCTLYRLGTLFQFSILFLNWIIVFH